MAKPRPLRIFILEDEIHQSPRNAILGVLKAHDLTIALSKTEAIKLYTPTYDLAIIDHDMYGWPDPNYHTNSGYAFLEWLVKQHPALPPIAFHSQNWMWMPKLVAFVKKHGVTPTAMPFGSEYLAWLAQVAAGKSIRGQAQG